MDSTITTDSELEGKGEEGYLSSDLDEKFNLEYVKPSPVPSTTRSGSGLRPDHGKRERNPSRKVPYYPAYTVYSIQYTIYHIPCI
jgi:hypothetical protein